MIFEDVSVVLVGQNHNPTLLNPDFLANKGIVPADWKLAAPPVCLEPFAQVAYANDVVFTAQLKKVVISQSRKDSSFEDSPVADLAKRYLEVVPLVDYQAVGINARLWFLFDKDVEAQLALNECLFKDGPWREFKDYQGMGSAKMTYPLDDGVLNLSVEAAHVESPLFEETGGVRFGANFHRDLPGSTQEDSATRLGRANEIIDAWKTDIGEFLEFVSKSFPLSLEGDG